jgi:hypothetical protein
VQIPAAVAVGALAACRSRFAEGRGGDGTVLATAAALAAASLIYQAIILAFAFLPLAAPIERLRRPSVFIGVLAVALCVPALMIGARLIAGDSPGVAVLTTFLGERGESMRASLASATPLKWAAALAAGPPQAIVGLWKFQGLSLLWRDLLAVDTDAVINAARLLAGLAVLGVLASATLRTRDWRLAVAVLGVLMLPIVRNQQYTYNKFYLLWPCVVALAAIKLQPRHIAAMATVVLTLNLIVLTRQIAEGRARYADARTAYANARGQDCFFTVDWGPPFWHTWPGSTTALIGMFWARNNQEHRGEDRISWSVKSCFCDAARVWTDATEAARTDLLRLTGHFGDARLPLVDFLYRPGDGSALPTSVVPMFMFSSGRQAELCEEARAVE